MSLTALIAALRTRLSRLVLLACSACAAGPALAAEVIEFHNANLDNYFITADRVEAAAIDAATRSPFHTARPGTPRPSTGNPSVRM